jgi:hypothetical protein
LLELRSAIDCNAFADAENQSNEAIIPACGINRRMEGLIRELVALRIALFGIFAAGFLRSTNRVKILNRLRFRGETPAGALEFGYDFEVFGQLSNTEFGDDCPLLRPGFHQPIRRKLTKGFPDRCARRAVLFSEATLIQPIARLQLQGENPP